MKHNDISNTTMKTTLQGGASRQGKEDRKLDDIAIYSLGGHRRIVRGLPQTDLSSASDRIERVDRHFEFESRCTFVRGKTGQVVQSIRTLNVEQMLRKRPVDYYGTDTTRLPTCQSAKTNISSSGIAHRTRAHIFLIPHRTPVFSGSRGH